MSLDVAVRKAAACEAAKLAGQLQRALEALPPAPEGVDPLPSVSALYAHLGAALSLIPPASEAPAPLTLAPSPAEESPTPEQPPRRRRRQE